MNDAGVETSKAVNALLFFGVPLVVIIVTVGLMSRLDRDVKRSVVHQLESIYQSDGGQQINSLQQNAPPMIATGRQDKVKDALQQLEQQHTTPVTSKDAATASSKSSSRRSPTLFFVKKGDAIRRLSSSELRTSVANGEFAPDDLIRKSEKDKWTKLSKVKGLDFPKPS